MAITNNIAVVGSTGVSAPGDFQSGNVIYSNEVNAALRNAAIGSWALYEALKSLDASSTYTMGNAFDTTNASLVTAVKNSFINAFQKCQNKLSITTWNTAKTVQSTTQFDGTGAVSFTFGDTLVNDSGTIDVSLNRLRVSGWDRDEAQTGNWRNVDYTGASAVTIKFDDNQFWIDSNGVIHLKTAT